MPNVTCPSNGVLEDLLEDDGIVVHIGSNPDIAGFGVSKSLSHPQWPCFIHILI